MAILTIRNLDPAVKARLRIRAAQHGHSMEEEARNILRTALPDVEESGADLARAMHSIFAEAAGDEPWEMPELDPQWVESHSIFDKR